MSILPMVMDQGLLTTKRVAAGGFDPLSLSPALWLKTDAGLFKELTGPSATTPAAADGDPVGSWLDQSGTNRHVTAPSLAGRATLKLALQNAMSIVRYDGIDDLHTVVMSIPQPFTVFLVAGSIIIFGSALKMGTPYIAFQNAPNFIAYAGVSVNYSTTSGDANWHLHEFVYNGAASAGAVDGVLVGPVDAGLANITNFSLPYDNTRPYDLGEVLIFPSALNATDRTSVRQYLKTRWGTP